MICFAKKMWVKDLIYNLIKLCKGECVSFLYLKQRNPDISTL